MTAPDSEILKWANEHEFVLVTNDLDFSAILAAGAVTGPTVIQLRTQGLLSDAAVSIVVNALEAHREAVERGALLSIDEAGRIKDGISALSIKSQLLSLEDRKAELQSRLNAPEILELLHPRMAEVYREKVGSLCGALEARRAARALWRPFVR